MNAGRVRITSIYIENFKNVVKGEIKLAPIKSYKVSILGLYGQNGSGKTALVDAVDLLRCALGGFSVPNKFGDYINFDAKYALLRFAFSIHNEEHNISFNAIYEFKIGKYANRKQDAFNGGECFLPYIYDEILKCSYDYNGQKVRLLKIIDTSSNDTFGPKAKYNEIIGTNDSSEVEIKVARGVAVNTRTSFVFSELFMGMLKRYCNIDIYKILVFRLSLYGRTELFVVSSQAAGLVSINILPISFRRGSEEQGIIGIGCINMPVDRATTIPVEAVNVLEKIVPSMNIVLSALVPGLSIKVINYGPEIMDNGNKGSRVQLISIKDGREIPFKCESEGIKKLISIMQLMILVHNKSNITVAVDELDSGVFEYLLGELLSILARHAKGQLIFTSHNLRPLETIDSGFIFFTTTNPIRRYTKGPSIKANNNLRSVYYRDIFLGSEDEELYDFTNNSKIELAFLKAGDYSWQEEK